MEPDVADTHGCAADDGAPGDCRATLSGTMVAVAGEAPIFDATSDGAEVRWSVRFGGVAGEMKLDFAGTVAGDSLDGTVQFGAFRSGGFTGARVADALGTFFG